LEVFINQANDVQVPETMVDLHVKFFRLAKGILTLRDSSFDSNDIVGKLLAIKKVTAYTQLFSDFAQNDCLNYFKQIGTN
jgi:cell wall assembly regulator SMI1